MVSTFFEGKPDAILFRSAGKKAYNLFGMENKSEAKAKETAASARTADPSKKAMAWVMASFAFLAVLIIAASIIGNLPEASVDLGPEWDVTPPGFYDGSGLRLLDGQGGISSFFSFAKAETADPYYEITAISVPDKAATLVLPSAIQAAGEETIPIRAIDGSEEGNNIFGASEASESLQAVYAPGFCSAIGQNAFAQMDGLAKVSFASAYASSGASASLECSLGARSFAGDPLLAEAILPRNLVALGDEAFADDVSLPNADFGNSYLRTIGERAFAGCCSLAYLKLPSTLKSIGSGAFDGAVALETIVYGGTRQSWNGVLKANGWADGSSLQTIQCSDGTATV